MFWDETCIFGRHDDTVNDGIDKKFLLGSTDIIVEFGEYGIFQFYGFGEILGDVFALRESFEENRNSIEKSATDDYRKSIAYIDESVVVVLLKPYAIVRI